MKRFPLLPTVLLALALLAGCGSAEQTGSTPASAGAQARSAASFVDSVGVNTHTYYDDTVYYSRFETIEQRLRELGIHHIRENLVPDRPDQYERLNELAAAGVKSTLILGDPDNGLAGLRRLVAILAAKLPDSVGAAEGPNEFDLRGGADWAPRLARYQAALYEAVKSNPALAGLPVVGPSVGRLEDEAVLPDLAADLDFGNIHPYPDGEPPESNIGEWLDLAPRMSGSKPVLATESGYHDALAASEGQQPVSEAAMATYVPRLFLEYFRRGIPRSFEYELADEFPDPAASEPESSFGLLRNDLSPKPAFTALRNLIAVLAEDEGEDADFTPERLDYALGGDTGDLHQVLLQKRDGRFYLALWRQQSVWDAAARAPLDPGAKPLQLRLAAAPRALRVYRPNQSAEPLAEPATSGGPISLEIGPQVTLVEIEAG